MTCDTADRVPLSPPRGATPGPGLLSCASKGECPSPSLRPPPPPSPPPVPPPESPPLELPSLLKTPNCHNITMRMVTKMQPITSHILMFFHHMAFFRAFDWR